jgi:hypothetical protein
MHNVRRVSPPNSSDAYDVKAKSLNPLFRQM